ncbi:unnamed protein product [Cylindrotheca closterium]|uniref:VWFD domain-containing protein n=1 Tax=Cylindrotheca closterium TaxID=2856 RepID=A0AAD2GC13_9STRA|nr:unnamed protein product [Cylindrotheca closterium]
MKLNSNLLSLAALAAFPSMASAGVDSCSEQVNCVNFSVEKLDTDSCSLGGECAVKVCMQANSGFNGCDKSGSFSHMCYQTDANGCPAWNSDGSPLMGASDSVSCADGFLGKCAGSNVMMCLEGKPGQTLYWVLKDGNTNDNPGEDVTYTKSFTVNGADTGCTSNVRCFNEEYNCGAKYNKAQAPKERTWAFTIPSSDGSSCDVCGSSPPSPTAPTPTAPVPTATPPIEPTPTAPTPTADNTTPTPGSNGDPHFKTWKNEHFEYHGQCDMVLTKDANFADGLGLDIQIRTKMVRFWSYIRNAAVRIGHDVIELEGSDDTQDQSIRFWYNMEFKAKDATTLGGFPMTIRRSHEKMTKVIIDLDSKYPGVKIIMATYKEFVRVDVEGATDEAFANTVGLLGDFTTGKTLARDGSAIDNFREYGSEWQVRPGEHMLFHNTAEPQFPKKCLEPEDPRGERRRRLEESDITMEQAEKACSALKDALDQKDCVYDILATQDMDMAGAF